MDELLLRNIGCMASYLHHIISSRLTHFHRGSYIEPSDHFIHSLLESWRFATKPRRIAQQTGFNNDLQLVV
jgi:hypothetical protein